MKVNLLPIQNMFAAYISKIAILTLTIFMATPHITYAATIAASINAGKHLITNGDTLVGPNGTRPGGEGIINASATDTSIVDTAWSGTLVNDTNGSSYGQSVYASAQVGHLQVRARTQSDPTINEVYYIWNSSYSYASWQDTITLTTAGITTGFMSFDLLISGSASAYGAGWQYEEEPGYFATYDAATAGWRLDIDLQGGALLGESYSGTLGGYSGYQGDPLGYPLPVSIQHNTIPITFGTPVELTVGFSASANANASSGESSMAEIRILNSLEWGGITSVVDANGNPVEFSLSSTSGYDYQLPFSNSASNPVVPIPPAIILFISGLLGLAMTGRRKNHAQ